MPNDINPPNNLAIFICESPQFDFWAEWRAGVQYSPTTLNCPRRQENAEVTFVRRVDLWGRRSHTRKLANGLADGFVGPIGVLRAQRGGLEVPGGIIQPV